MPPQAQKQTSPQQGSSGSGSTPPADNATQAVKEAKKASGSGNVIDQKPLSGKVIDNTGDPQVGSGPVDVDEVRNRLSSDQPMVVEEDVWVAFFPPNSKRKAYRLAFTQGQIVMKSAYNALVNPDTKDDEESDDNE